MTYLFLDRVAQGRHAGAIGNAAGHPEDVCVEVRDLVARFPLYSYGVVLFQEGQIKKGKPVPCPIVTNN